MVSSKLTIYALGDMYKNWLKLLWYENLVSSPSAMWMLPLVSGGGLLLLVDIHADAFMRFEQIAAVAEIIMPLAVMFISTGLVLREREENSLVFAAIRSSLTVLWVRRLCALFLWYSFWLGILMTIYNFFYLPISIVQMVFASVSVSLVLTGVSSVASLIMREMSAGYLIGTFLWGTCLIAHKFSYSILGSRLYLFYLWFGMQEEIGIDGWVLNKLSLTIAGVMFILIAVFLLRSRERFFT